MISDSSVKSKNFVFFVTTCSATNSRFCFVIHQDFCESYCNYTSSKRLSIMLPIYHPIKVVKNFHDDEIEESRNPIFGSSSTNIQLPEITTGMPFVATIITYIKRTSKAGHNLAVCLYRARWLEPEPYRHISQTDHPNENVAHANIIV